MSDIDIFCLKMRASKNEEEKSVHISGAEKIVSENQVIPCIDALVDRGLHHSKGNADFLNVKVERINKSELTYLDALPVSTVEVETWQDGHKEIEKFLVEIGVANPQGVMEFIQETYAMRGAMILDVKNLKRLEPDCNRGIRATYMDQERVNSADFKIEKNHYEEAIVLATKVANCPGIIGEICISDDPGYVTGYVASLKCGYRRITKMKELGSENGGRIFLYEGPAEEVHKTIEYLEKHKVIVRNVKPIKCTHAKTQEKADPLSVLEKNIEHMKDNNLFRTMKKIDSAQGSHVTIDGRDYVLMASNSYLDITTHPHMIMRCTEAINKYGVGSGGSRLTTGNMDLHEQLEEKIAKFKNTEDSIVFNTGYVANLATISAIMKNGGIIFSDELNHASIIDGCRLSRAKCVVYKHNDMDDLAEKIKQNPCEFGMAVSDAVFSMDGDILNLPKFLRVCKENKILSMVDEAHSTGVIGATGHGIIEYYNIAEKPDILMGTLSKAVGGEGGYVAGSKILIQYLRNNARGFIFSTSLSAPAIAANIAGIEIIEKEPELVKKLQNNVKFFCEELNKRGINISSETAIVPIVIGDEKRAMEVSDFLMENGFFISAIRYPTVAKGAARLRVAIMASHTEEELSKAAELIAQVK